jgi:hypothetical protein
MNNHKKSKFEPDIKDKKFKIPIPDQAEIEYLLRTTQPKPSARFYNNIERRPWNRGVRSSIWQRFRFQSLPIALGLIVVVIIILSSPSLEAVAQRIARFFTPAVSDQVIFQIPLFDPSDLETQVLYDLKEALDLVAFKIKVPVPPPPGYHFKSAEFKPDREAIVMNYESDSGNLLRISQRKNGVEYQSISIHALVETVKIGNQKGEYVTGGWKATPTEAEVPADNQEISIQAVWDPDSNIHFLRWQENDILYEILFIGHNPNSQDYLEKDDLLLIAENLE